MKCLFWAAVACAGAVLASPVVVTEVRASAPEAEPRIAAAPAEEEPQDFGHLDLEELRTVRVVTARRVEESILTVPAAAHVISATDIRRSGARTLPDLLRLSPGVEVAQINSRLSTVTVRGFNGTAANKLLPMIDGRSIYSQRFSGTIWDARDIVLEDVERIEVIRGPGGTAWGANAVNGVINVLTKDARDTQGTLVSLGGGSLLRGFGTVRHGFALGDGAWMRVFAKGFARGETSRLDGGDANDSWSLGHAGFRADFERKPGTHWSVTGDAFTSEADQILPPTTPSTALSSGGGLQVRGRMPAGPGRVTTLNAYYDRLQRNSGGLKSEADVIETDLQHEWPAGRHQLLVGANARLSRLEDADAVINGVWSLFDPNLRWFHQAGVFLQDQFSIVQGRLVATAGCKLEYDDFTGASPLPNLRLAWTPSAEYTLWAAVARATRIPSRGENDQTTITPGPFVSNPNDELDPEKVTAWEVGGRTAALRWLTLDLSAFYNDYEGLYGTVSSSATSSSQANAFRGETWGGEAELACQPAPWWQLRGSLSFVEIALRRSNPGASSSSEVVESLSPAQQGSLRSSWTFGSGVEGDLWFRHVGELPGTTARVPDYSTLDSRISWQLPRGVLVSLSGKNLLEPLHQEFRFFKTRWEIPRSFVGEVAFRF